MNPRKRKVATLAAILAAAVVVGSVAYFFVLLEPKHTPLALVSHSPITIRGNEGFTSANGVSGGTGSSDDPYVISGWSIEGSNFSNCLSIFDTTARFIVTDIKAEKGMTGIYLFNAINGRVEHSVIGNMSATGITVTNSDSIAVMHNTIRNCPIGINVLNANNIRLDDNAFSGNVQDVRKPPAGPWEQGWLGDAVCVALLVPLAVIVGLAIYFRFFRKPGSQSPPQTQLQPPGEVEEAPYSDGKAG